MKSFLLTITLFFHVLEATSLFIAGMLTVGVFNMSAHSTARISHPAVSIRIHDETQHLVFLVFVLQVVKGVGVGMIGIGVGTFILNVYNVTHLSI